MNRSWFILERKDIDGDIFLTCFWFSTFDRPLFWIIFGRARYMRKLNLDAPFHYSLATGFHGGLKYLMT